MSAMTSEPVPKPGGEEKPRPAKTPAKTPSPQPPATTYRLDWETWAFGPVLGPTLAGGGIATLAMAGDLADVTPAWGMSAGVAAGIAMTVRAARREISPVGLAARAGCWLATGGWMAWALSSSAWSPDVLAALAAGTLGVALAGPIAEDHEERVAGRAAKAKADEAQAVIDEAQQVELRKIRDEWQARLVRVCGDRLQGIKITGVKQWPDNVGFTLRARLPEGGATWETIGSHVSGLATDANLDHGCGVEVGPGETRGLIHIRVTTKDTTAVAKDYPDDYSPLTLNGDLPIGMHKGGQVASINLLDDPAITTGRRGSGKTVNLNTINIDLVRCPDVLLWHIDLNAGGMSSPWLRPWLNGDMPAPVIDWVATTEEEALLMVRTAVVIAKGRKTAYKQHMADINDDKISISANLPAIYIVLDEGAEAIAANRGNKDLMKELEVLVSVARAARVGVLLSTLRATADIIGAAIFAQIGVKIWMRPESRHEISQLFGWTIANSVDVEEAPHPGSGILQTPGRPGARSFRGYLIKPKQIVDAALACGPRRPTLDGPSKRFAGSMYDTRWDRFGSWLESQGEEAPMPPAQRDPSDEPERKRPELKPEHRGLAGMGNAVADMNEALEALRKRADEVQAERDGAQPKPDATPERPAAEVDDEFAALVSGLDVQVTDVDEITRIVAAAGPEGVSASSILAELKTAGIDISRATLYRRLDAMDNVHQPREGVYAIKPDPS